jgi:hypothetical protein
LRDWNVFWPRIVAKTRVRRLGKRPQGKRFCTLKSFRMEIVGSLLFLLLEGYAEDVAVQFATFGRLADDWTKTCDEQNVNLVRNLFAIFFS